MNQFNIKPQQKQQLHQAGCFRDKGREMEYKLTHFNLRDSIRQLLEPLAINNSSGELSLSALIPECIPPCLWGNQEQLQQTLLALVDNAAKATEAHTLSLECELVNQQADRLELCFTIKNSDDTVASQIYPRQCLTFYRHQQETRNQQSSTALRILVVEDNEINLKLAEHILRKGGYLVDWAPSGENALEQVEQERYDLILMDIHMPELDGFQTTKLIRQREQGKEVPIIALTADTIQGYRERCLDAGMNSYLPKPYSKEELLTEVRRLLPPRESEPLESILLQKHDSTEGGWLNLEAILAKTQGNRALFSKMATIFVHRAPELLRSMQIALEAQKLSELAELAHAMKGMLGNFTETGPFRTAHQIEILAKAGAYAALNTHFGQLQQEVSELRELFQQNL